MTYKQSHTKDTKTVAAKAGEEAGGLAVCKQVYHCLSLKQSKKTYPLIQLCLSLGEDPRFILYFAGLWSWRYRENLPHQAVWETQS